MWKEPIAIFKQGHYVKTVHSPVEYGRIEYVRRGYNGYDYVVSIEGRKKYPIITERMLAFDERFKKENDKISNDFCDPT